MKFLLLLVQAHDSFVERFAAPSDMFLYNIFESRPFRLSLCIVLVHVLQGHEMIFWDLFSNRIWRSEYSFSNEETALSVFITQVIFFDLCRRYSFNRHLELLGNIIIFEVIFALLRGYCPICLVHAIFGIFCA